MGNNRMGRPRRGRRGCGSRLRETLEEVRRGLPPRSLSVELHAVSTLAYDDQMTE